MDEEHRAVKLILQVVIDDAVDDAELTSRQGEVVSIRSRVDAFARKADYLEERKPWLLPRVLASLFVWNRSPDFATVGTDVCNRAFLRREHRLGARTHVDAECVSAERVSAERGEAEHVDAERLIPGVKIGGSAASVTHLSIVEHFPAEGGWVKPMGRVHRETQVS